jgi:hypothetical protein
MIYLKESTDIQYIKFIPKDLNATSIILRNDSTNIELTENLDFYIENYYLVASTVFDLKENQTYDLIVKNGSDVVYIDKVFCTNQTLDTYTINQNTYTEVSSSNTIFYE